MKRNLFFAVFILLVFSAKAHVWVNDEVFYYANGYLTAPVYPSIAYFTFRETQWYREIDLCLDGYLHLYSSPFMAPNKTIANPVDAYDLPNFLLVNLGDELLDMNEVKHAADILNVDIIILILNHRTWKAKLSFWWSHKLPQSAYLEASSSRYFLVAVTANTGKKLENWLSMKQSLWNDDPNLFDSKELIVGIDDASIAKGSDVVVKASFYLIVCIVICKWLCASQPESSRGSSSRNPSMSQQSPPAIQGADLALGVIQEGSSHECAICLDIMPVGSCVRVLPCRHSFHHDCIVGWFGQTKYTCPLCKFDLRQHLEEQRSAHEDPLSDIPQRRWVPFRRRIATNQDGLLDTIDEGDLELTESSTTQSTSGELT